MYLARLSAFICVAMTARQIGIAEVFAKLRTPCAEEPLQQEILDLITPTISKRSTFDENDDTVVTPNVEKVVTTKPRSERS